MIYPKEMVVLVGLHSGNRLISNKTLYYRFLVPKDGVLQQATIIEKSMNTSDVFESILTHFFVDKQLISEGYDLRKINSSKEEYYGIKLENSEGEKLNIYYSSRALSFAENLEPLVQKIKCRDFYEYSKKLISKRLVERMTIRPGEEHSGVLYVYESQQSSYLKKRRELGIYYRESQGNVDSIDLSIVLKLIRFFINSHLESSLYYKYEGCKLLIGDEISGHFIEMKNENIIDAVEHARILDDLWLLMHGVISSMPLQEESMENKEMLRTLKKNYLENH